MPASCQLDQRKTAKKTQLSQAGRLSLSKIILSV